MSRSDGLVTLFLCGDVMPGRGIDQILPHPGDPELREDFLRDARHYVDLAEAANGPIPRPVGFAWPWGDTLRILDQQAPDARVINLETSVTSCGDFAPGKAVHYRMSPANARSLSAGRPDLCVLANNHVLDFGHRGLEETLQTLSDVGLSWVGAGGDAVEASRPATVELPSGGRVVVLACGSSSSGIPADWAAARDRPGVNLIPDLSDRTADVITDRLNAVHRPGDLLVVSVHWGSNWGYDVAPHQVHFAHRLVDSGVDIVHGHSSHHPRPIEVYGGRLILYGCGDFIDDYEGIRGRERFRDDLRLLYFPSLEPGSGSLTTLRMVVMQARQMRLCPASEADVHWLRKLLTRISRPFGTRIELDRHQLLTVRLPE
ncbi:MAG: CapA family protein [Haloechinothrix sp.]